MFLSFHQKSLLGNYFAQAYLCKVVLQNGEFEQYIVQNTHLYTIFQHLSLVQINHYQQLLEIEKHAQEVFKNRYEEIKSELSKIKKKIKKG